MDNWVNWGDFIGANQGALDDYRRSVEGAQAEQEKAMQAALQQLAMDTEEANQAASMATSAANSYDAKAAVAKEPVTQGRAPAPSTYAGQPSNPVGMQAANANRAISKQKASYADLMAAGAKGMTYTQANPGTNAWESALYGQQAKYTNPWTDFEKKANEVGTLKTGDAYNYGAAAQAAADRYNTAKAEADAARASKDNIRTSIPPPTAPYDTQYVAGSGSDTAPGSKQQKADTYTDPWESLQDIRNRAKNRGWNGEGN